MSAETEGRPLCWDECAEWMRSTALTTGSAVNVIVCPEVVVVGMYPPFIATCRHGVTYLCEPSTEQIAEWVRTKTP